MNMLDRHMEAVLSHFHVERRDGEIVDVQDSNV